MSEASQQTVFLTESRGTIIVRNALRLVVAFVALAFVLSTVIPVDEVTKVRGEVVPLGNVQTVQSLDGGLIEEVLVEEGQKVNAGDVIAHFEPTGARAELGAAQAARAALRATQLRLEAFSKGEPMDLSDLEANFPNIVAQQVQALDAAIKLRGSNEDVLEQRVAETREELAANEKEIPIAESQLKTAKDALQLMEKAVNQGAISRTEYNQRLQEVATYSRDVSTLRGRNSVLKAKLTESERELAQVDDKSRSETREQLAEVAAKLRAADEQLASLKKRVERTALLAPVEGYVTSLPETRKGAVVQPGGIVAELVPISAEFIFKVQIPPKDIGFVRLEQPAVVKIDAFDYSRYGSLPGMVFGISPTTIVNREGVPFYEARISLERSQFEINDQMLTVSSGMTGEADIRTGRKTVFQYMWKPVFTTFTTAFSER